MSPPWKDGPARGRQALLGQWWQMLRPHRRSLARALGMMLVAAFLHLCQPYIVERLIDDGILARRPGWLALTVILLAVAIVGRQVARYAQSMAIASSGLAFTHELRTRCYEHLLSLRCSYFDREPQGKLITNLTSDTSTMLEGLKKLFVVVEDGLTFMVITGLVFSISAELALLVFALLVSLMAVVVQFRRIIRGAEQSIRQLLGAINAFLQEHVSGAEIIQAFRQEEASMRRFSRLNDQYHVQQKSVVRYESLVFGLVELLSSVAIALVLWYGGMQEVSFGTLVAFINYMQKLFVPAREVSVSILSLQRALAASERVFDLLATDQREPAVAADAARPSAGMGRGAIVFDRVSFHYAAGKLGLDRVSLAIRARERVGIVGATGAGKSTIVRLLIRLYEPQTGDILLGGRDVRTIPLEELRRRVVVVSQDVFLFEGTVAENISLDDPGIAPEDVRAAADAIGLTALMPLDRQLLEHGENLSAGERQLIAFARALARDPDVLVLDEATAAVDAASERIVQQALDRLVRDRTTIIVAHRLDTIARVDRILVLDRGRIVEQGSHAELLARHGIYRRLHASQRPG